MICSEEAEGHDWEQIDWEYDDSFFKCKRCKQEAHQRCGIPLPDDHGPCVIRTKGPT